MYCGFRAVIRLHCALQCGEFGCYRSHREHFMESANRFLGGVLISAVALARKIRDFINTKGLAMVQIRCLSRFETKSEAFACPNIPQQTVSFFQIFLIDRWSRNLINDRAVPMVEQFFSRLPSGALG